MSTSFMVNRITSMVISYGWIRLFRRNEDLSERFRSTVVIHYLTHILLLKMSNFVVEYEIKHNTESG
jgi:hypothetical protein